METAIIVPARIGSTRLPRKLLADVHGKPLVLWTADRIREQEPDLPLYFAVDGPELETLLNDAGYTTIATEPGLVSGTDRIAVANRRVEAEIVVNVQADEPLVTARQIHLLIEQVENGADMATLGTPFASCEQFRDPNKVKVLRDREGRAIYFSRAPIPFRRDEPGIDEAWLGGQPVLRHLGLYAYDHRFLRHYASLEPTALEQAERLEQLRALEHGCHISVAETRDPIFGIDHPVDLERFRELVTT